MEQNKVKLLNPDARPRACPKEPLFEWPEDVSCLVGTSVLIHWTMEAAQQLPMTEKPFAAPGREAVSTRRLLMLLAYGYSTGTYASTEIRRRFHSDPAVRFLAGNTEPDATVLLRFRRRFRPDLVGLLAGLLRIVWIRHSAGRPPMGQPDFHREAEDRVHAAIQSDSAELDV